MGWIKVGRLIAGQNVSAFSYESGTYATTSGTAQWMGEVQSFDPDDTENIQRIRYHGTGTRSVDKSTPGARDQGGSFEFFPQDLKMLMFALGNGSDTNTGSPTFFSHALTQLESTQQSPVTSGLENPFTSFGLEVTQQFNPTGGNFVRTYKGCMVDTYTLSKDDNSAPLTSSVDFIAKTLAFSSGAPTFGAPSENTRRPHAPFDTTIHVPSGTAMDGKSWSLTVSNNIDRDGAHVTNNSRNIKVPTPTEREYEFTLTIDGESTEAARLYGIWKSGGDTTVNAAIQINLFGNTASGISWVTMSGCDIDAFSAPSPVEGINEWELTLIPKNVDAVAQDDIVNYLPF